MGERRFQDLTPLDEVLKIFGEMDADDAEKMALCLNILVFRTGFVDGTYEPDAELYRFIDQNFNDIDQYLRYLGLKLYSDSDTRQVWIDITDEGHTYVPFSKQPMNTTQIILLCVLQKRIATNSSSREIGTGVSTGVLLTETDILKEMFPYIRKKDDKQKRDTCIAAIHRFTNDLGLLRVVAERFPVGNGVYDTVYRVSPYIQHNFDAAELDRIRDAYLAEAEKVAGNGVENNDDNKEDVGEENEPDMLGDL